MLECLEAALLNIEEEKSQPRLDSYFKGTVSLILNDPTRKDSNDHLQLYPDLYLYCCGRKRRFFWFEKYFKSKNWSGHFRREPTKEKKTFLINQNMDV